MAKHEERGAPAMTRRTLLVRLGTAAAALPVVHLLGCDDDDDSDAENTERLSDAGSVDARTDPDATSGDATLGAAWATGGTAAMVAKALYPNPFTALGTSCAVHCTTTIGPCHTTSPERSDVSDGSNGLPVRMALRVVNANCQPVPNAIVEIWHTNYGGIYSGRISSMCNSAEADRAAQYFRGYQRSDADGKVWFDTCFPGWYSGRAVHVHVRVQTGSYDAADGADNWVITQLLFSDALNAEIFANEPLYKARGQPDTLLSADNVIGATSDKSPYLFDTVKMSDGAMLASKTIVLRNLITDASCATQGASGGGPGGPPFGN